MPTVSLSDRALLSVSGPEARSFLQTIVTADLETLAADELRACALLTPQGKILFDFLISSEGDDGLRLDIRADAAADFARRLTMYRLRAKVEIGAPRDADVMVAWGESAAEGLRDTRFPAEWHLVRRYGAEGSKSARDSWDALRIRAGVAESGSDFALGDAFPHDVLLDQNQGVALRKGCFVGQEVVSRMHHRGTARRRIVLVSGASPLPAPGADVLAGGKTAGTLGTTLGSEGLALLRLDRVAEARAAGEAITADGVPVEVALPPGVSFGFPSAESQAPSA